MDRQDKSTGRKIRSENVRSKMQTQHHNHKPKVSLLSAISRTNLQKLFVPAPEVAQL
jgi:hypothetical protein